MIKKVVGLLGLAVLLASCNGNDAKLSFDVGSNYNFGSVVITKFKTATFKLSNISESPVFLETISNQSLGLSGEFSLVDGTCTTGLELAIGSSCTMVVEFAPSQIGEKFETLKVQFKNAEEKEIETEELLITARGEIDCSVSAELAAKYSTGGQDAQTKNASDTQKGTVDGQSLTYNNGQTDGIQASYQVGYQKGYYSANGHDAGYVIGHQEGKSVGLDSLSSCQNGAAAGDHLGKLDGKEDGEYEGYDDGYFAGKDDGYDKGHFDGYLKGEAACTVRVQTPVQILTVIQNRQALINLGQFEKLCYERGFSEKRNLNSYNNAYAHAKNNNPQYQSGFTSGYNIGYAQGETAGIKEGFAKGRSVGFYEGEKLGKEIVYSSCYANGYEKAYKYWYVLHYDASFDIGFDHGFDDGYEIGFIAGEKEGCSDAGNNFVAAPSELAVKGKSYGKDQSFIREADGVLVVAHAQNDFSSQALSTLIAPTRKSELQNSISLYKVSMRELLSKEKIRAKIALPKKTVIIKK